MNRKLIGGREICQQGHEYRVLTQTRDAPHSWAFVSQVFIAAPMLVFALQSIVDTHIVDAVLEVTKTNGLEDSICRFLGHKVL